MTAIGRGGAALFEPLFDGVLVCLPTEQELSCRLRYLATVQHFYSTTLNTIIVVFTGQGPSAAAAPASIVEAVVRSPTNMAAAKIAAVDFNKMTTK